MKRLIYLCSLSALMACKPMEKVAYVPAIHDVETIIRDTIVDVRIPEHYAERETRDTLSELSNPFAYSRAMVSNGTLTHTLGIHPTATVKEKVVYTETIVHDSIPYPVEVPVYVDKPMPVWEQSLIGGCAIILLIVVGCTLDKLKP